MSERREVEIGDRRYPIYPFSPRKVFQAGKLLAKVEGAQRKIDKQLATYRSEYRADNAEFITQAMAGLPPWSEALSHMTAEDWQRVGGQVEYRSDPSDGQMFLMGLQSALELAEEEMTRLLALVVIPNGELAQAVRDGQQSVADKLDTYATNFLDEASLGQLVDLAVAAVDTLREELGGKAKSIAHLRKVARKGLFKMTDDPSETDQQEEVSERKPTSSSDSPEPSDGHTESASTESPFESPEPSLSS